MPQRDGFASPPWPGSLQGLARSTRRNSGRQEECGDDGQVCLANKTPAFLVPGPPPGRDADERSRLYAQHGIELVVTGDVYEAEFEKYRDEFNSATLAGIEAERGQGYVKKLSDDIEARMSRRYQSKK